MFSDDAANVASSQLAHKWGKADHAKQMAQQAKQKAQQDKLRDVGPVSQGEPSRKPTTVSSGAAVLTRDLCRQERPPF